MQTLKQEAIDAISKLPETAHFEEITYRLYIIDRVKKGLDAIKRGESIAVADLKVELGSW
ncbi:hypothetical protein SPSIL_041370 [Sporomusa silvacetica DSM 10669]|uniref:Uncharacterized protein n=1 Tax=Sporomusa silvacetica DSM 10669 TaxID=1123289 RepID=A0ABZ3IRA0_9FIRM|nr:hypothetical protein [Sporomusa silvacetica]OZC20399.1 hypothetical protein SPSIL_12660 [Sporomusa silvacetica DSM 10669]